jgi:hypothetical protein
MFSSIYQKFICFLLICAYYVFSGPKIEFDSKTYDCGTIIEGKTEKLIAVFNFKNTGDSVLKIENVRPGCGCTVVKYDTLIQPGKSSKINAEVNIKGYHSGKVSKSITVSSNAKNESMVKLSIEAIIESIIDVSESYLQLSTEKIITLTTSKKDLLVNEVVFKVSSNADVPSWQKEAPISCKFTFTPQDSLVDNKKRVYKLSIIAPHVEKTTYGSFIIKTNHPDKPEISLGGSIVK